MIKIYIDYLDKIDEVELNEKLNIKESLQLIYHENFDYGYIFRHQHVEMLNQSFEEAKISNGEIIKLIK